MLNIWFFKQTISHLKQKFYKFKSTLSTWGLHAWCVLSSWVAPILKCKFLTYTCMQKQRERQLEKTNEKEKSKPKHQIYTM
jgi:hypothetical protein